MDKIAVLQMGAYPAWDEERLNHRFAMHRYFEGDAAALLERHGSDVRAIATRGELGAGRALIDAAAAEARARGARRLTLRVLGPNAGARRLYESAGFVVEGIQHGEFVLEGREVDDVMMALDLT